MRAPTNAPQLLLADEPTAQLDSENGPAIMELLRRLVASEGISAMAATHDPLLVEAADRWSS